MTYEDHIQAMAKVYRDYKDAARVLDEAYDRRSVAEGALKDARAAMRAFTEQQISQALDAEFSEVGP